MAGIAPAEDGGEAGRQIDRQQEHGGQGIQAEIGMQPGQTDGQRQRVDARIAGHKADQHRQRGGTADDGHAAMNDLVGTRQPGPRHARERQEQHRRDA